MTVLYARRPDFSSSLYLHLLSSIPKYALTSHPILIVINIKHSILLSCCSYCLLAPLHLYNLVLPTSSQPSHTRLHIISSSYPCASYLLLHLFFSPSFTVGLVCVTIVFVRLASLSTFHCFNYQVPTYSIGN